MPERERDRAGAYQSIRPSAAAAAAHLRSGGLFDRTRRVVVKSRIVRHRGRYRSAQPRSPPTSPISKREGVTRDGENACMFDAQSETADENGFADRCRGDRHYFRFIVSPEEGVEMTDLKAFTRDLLADMERDLATRLDWIAVEHWNTNNPHVHLLVRGTADDGRDLVISSDYITRGMRARAEDLVTIELGPKNELEIHSALERDVMAERWTRLDRAIARQADETGLIDLRPSRLTRLIPKSAA